MKLRTSCLSDKQCELIGRIILQHSSCDFMVTTVLRGMLGIDEVDSAAIIHPENLDKKIRCIERIIDRKAVEVTDKAKLKEVFSQIRNCDRNLIAHGLLSLEGGNWENPAITSLSKSVSKPLTDEYLLDVLLEIEIATDMLFEFNRKYQFITFTPKEEPA